MAGGLADYAALCARVRIKYSRLLSGAEMQILQEAPNLNSLAGSLQRTAYADTLLLGKDLALTPTRIIQAIRQRLQGEAASVIQGAPMAARRVLRQVHRQHEVANLKALLRGVAAQGSVPGGTSRWERLGPILFPVASPSGFIPRQVAEAETIAAAVEHLRGTPYYEPLSVAMKRYSAENNLFPLEVALDLSYWRTLWQDVRRLRGPDQVCAMRIVGRLVDVHNLMWAIRYRLFRHASEEELINYTLPFGQRVADEDIRAIGAGADLEGVVTRIFPELSASAGSLIETQGGLARLETMLQRMVAQRCLTALLGSPFHIGIPIAYLVLLDLELRDLIVMVEARTSGATTNEFTSFLVRSHEMDVAQPS